MKLLESSVKSSIVAAIECGLWVSLESDNKGEFVSIKRMPLLRSDNKYLITATSRGIKTEHFHYNEVEFSKALDVLLVEDKWNLVISK